MASLLRSSARRLSSHVRPGGPTVRMTTKSRRLLFSCLGALLLGVSLLWLATSGTDRYQAQSQVVVKPYTNTVFTRSFESKVVHKIPGVIRLRVTPSFSARPTLTSLAVTNGAVIALIVAGATSLDAQRLANEAAATFCASAQQLYGGTAELIEMADRARPYSFFHDSLQPGIARLFKR
jgi:hypothetical protein